MKDDSKICPYCEGPVRFSLSSKFLVGTEKGPVWYCAQCSAWTHIFPKSPGMKPIGLVANAELRAAHAAANAEFEALWTSHYHGYTPQILNRCSEWSKGGAEKLRKGKAKQAVWSWLAGKIGVPRTYADRLMTSTCRVEMLNLEQCARFMQACAEYKDQKKVSNG